MAGFQLHPYRSGGKDTHTHTHKPARTHTDNPVSITPYNPIAMHGLSTLVNAPSYLTLPMLKGSLGLCSFGLFFNTPVPCKWGAVLSHAVSPLGTGGRGFVFLCFRSLCVYIPMQTDTHRLSSTHSTCKMANTFCILVK